jgi:hypothetical protein
MVSAYELSEFEIGLIKAMRAYTRLNLQQILAHFTYPHRDLNHRVIAQIKSGAWRPDVPAASPDELVAFMQAMNLVIYPNPLAFKNAAGRPTFPLRLHLDWWPVGQGLFASGSVERAHARPLTWTYDCGTSSAGRYIDEAIKSFVAQQRSIGAHAIQLAVLSHFDNDHINGFVRLIGRRPVRTLLLPYLPFWQRMLFALEQGIGANDERFGFYLDPATYLRAVPDSDIGEIVFVSAAGPDDAAEPDDSPDEPSPEGRVEALEDVNLKHEPAEPPPEAADDPMLAGSQATQISFMRPGARLLAPFYWEFVPYNDAELASKATSAFLTTIAPMVADLKDKPSKRVQALKDLKAEYTKQFGPGGKRLNLISLFLYAGPVGRGAKLTTTTLSHGTGLRALAPGFSQMHTGDGTLDAARYPAFQRFFAPDNRLARAKIFQVMHHGAEINWHAGVAAKLAPHASIFSSDPARGHHPHESVLRDFWTHYPIQVDKETGFRLKGYITR